MISHTRYVPTTLNCVTRDGSFLRMLYLRIIQFGRVSGPSIGLFLKLYLLLHRTLFTNTSDHHQIVA